MPPIPRPLTLEATVEPGHPSYFHFVVTGAQGGPELVVDFGDGDVATLAVDDPATVDHVYMQPGAYTATATTSSQSASVEVTAAGRTAVVPPNELELLLGLEPDEAARVAALVQLTVEAYLWPATVPNPVPPPVHAVGLALAARFSGAALTKAGAVTSESIGAYSYRLASPLTFDNVVLVLGELAEILDPWAPWHQGAYTLDTSPGPMAPWPVDWWQRDLDRIYSEGVL